MGGQDRARGLEERDSQAEKVDGTKVMGTTTQILYYKDIHLEM